MSCTSHVALTVRAIFDSESESIGISAEASEAFDAGGDTRAQIEVLAAITAKANCIAADVIGRWDADDDRKRALFDHYAALKENMLHDMLRQLDLDADAETESS